MNKIALKKSRLKRRKSRIKKKIFANIKLPRLCINRSNKHFFAQIINDSEGKILLAVSTLSKEFPEMKSKSNKEAAKALGKILADKAVASGIKNVVFDRNGYLYHGKIKAFADSVRENGLEI